jgi:hypothetical protein
MLSTMVYNDDYNYNFFFAERHVKFYIQMNYKSPTNTERNICYIFKITNMVVVCNIEVSLVSVT